MLRFVLWCSLCLIFIYVTCICMKESVFSSCKEQCSIYVRRLSLSVVFIESFYPYWLFCQLHFSIVKRDTWKFLGIMMICLFSCSFFNFCFICFEIILLGAYQFRVVTASWWNCLSLCRKVFAASYFFALKSVLADINIATNLYFGW